MEGKSFSRLIVSLFQYSPKKNKIDSGWVGSVFMLSFGFWECLLSWAKIENHTQKITRGLLHQTNCNDSAVYNLHSRYLQQTRLATNTKALKLKLICTADTEFNVPSRFIMIDQLEEVNSTLWGDRPSQPLRDYDSAKHSLVIATCDDWNHLAQYRFKVLHLAATI